MAINYYTDGAKMPDIRKRETNEWIKQVAAIHGKKCGDIAYIFCSDEKILEVNNQYLNHDYYTDIITFDYTEKNRISGDIFISVDTVLSNSKEYCSSFNEEINRIIIHGILHLCGIQDKGDAERASMTRWENEALALLNDIRN